MQPTVKTQKAETGERTGEIVSCAGISNPGENTCLALENKTTVLWFLYVCCLHAQKKPLNAILKYTSICLSYFFY